MKYEVEYTVGPLMVDHQPPSIIINADSPEEAKEKFVKLMPVKASIWSVREYMEPVSSENTFSTIVSPIFTKKNIK